jgi:carboxylate-amine ligase
MASNAPYSFGIEEEFFVVDATTLALAAKVPPAFLRACRARLGDRVHEEMKLAQVETATAVLHDHGAARRALAHSRGVLADAGEATGLAIIAAGTHPTAAWLEHARSGRDRYARLEDEFQIVGRRNLVCGMHVHVEVPSSQDRVVLMNRLMPWVPLLLALSASSPFWQARATGLSSYRQALYDEWPRSGIPDAFDDEAQYAEFVAMLARCGALEDGGSLWFAVRPSAKFPTIELRIADACPRVEDTLAIAAAFRCLVRAHARLPALGARRTAMTRRLIEENRWSSKRHGVRATFVDEATGQPEGVIDMLHRMTELVAEDAAALGCERELRHLTTIALVGNGADAQLAVHQNASGSDPAGEGAMAAVLGWLVEETRRPPVELADGTRRRHQSPAGAANA